MTDFGLFATGESGVKKVFRWVFIILKLFIILLLLPFWALYVWIKWRITRRAFIRATCKAGMEARAAKSLAGVLSPSRLMREIEPRGFYSHN